MSSDSQVVVEHTDGAVIGGVRLLLSAEAAAVLALSLFAYASLGASWWIFAAAFLLPDLAMVGYLRGPAIGAAAYNAAHTYTPALLLLAAGLTRWPAAEPFALIWIAHIGWDRMMGYGLKYPAAFGATHLGRVGRPVAR